MQPLKMMAAAAALGALAVLPGCSGEPSEADMRQAVQKSIQEASNAADAASRFLTGDDRGSGLFKVEIETFEKIGCKEAQGAPGYVCDYRMSLTKDSSVIGALAGGAKDVGQARFVKAKDGWIQVSGN
jgi:hypothetical protein